MKNTNRACPACSKNICYKTESACQKADLINSVCYSCAAKIRIQKYGYGDSFAKFTQKGASIGKTNPFYGRTHSHESKEKMKVDRNKDFFQTEEYKQKVSKQCSGAGNPMYGKNYYQIWVQKYGKEKADELQKDKSQRTSRQCKGEKNPMYGKPAPQGSGNGWSGWYKNWFFRSLRELSYVINVLEPNGDEWKSAEFIKIPYTNWEGTIRNYLPDFLVNSRLLVEIKPTRLQSSVTVRAKQQAATIFAATRGWEYVLIDPPQMNKEQVALLHSQGKIRFTNKYEILFQEYYTQVRQGSLVDFRPGYL